MFKECEMQPNILLIVLDTVRADTFSCYGNLKSTTPNLDEVATHGILFENAFSSSPWTLPSHASMFTGLYPSEHGATQQNLKLREDIPTIAALLKEKGYTTISLSSNQWFCKPHGLTRGFDIALEPDAFRHSLPERILNRLSGYRLYREGFIKRRTPILLEKAFGLLQDVSGPFFMFINLMDAHLPYHPLPKYRYFLDTHLDHIWQVNQDAAKYITGLCEMSAEDFEILQGLYWGEVAALDAEVGKFLDALDGQEMSNNLVQIVASDHGENLGDHEFMDHQLCLYDTLLHVPLIFSGEGLLAEGLVVEDMVSLNSLFATICDLTGRDVEEQFPNISPPLTSYLTDTSGSSRGDSIFAEYIYPSMYLDRLSRYAPEVDLSKWARGIKSIRTNEYKYIVYDDEQQELFDIQQDPDELHNIYSLDHKAIPELEKEILLRERRFRLPQDSGKLSHEDLDKNLKDRLESLGYL
jgi:arylsulfatase A-like enzyme